MIGARRGYGWIAVVLTLFLLSAAVGCGGGRQAGPAEPIIVGVPGPFSGAAAEKGQNLKYGVELAAEEINEAGGIMGREVRLVYADTEAKAEVGVSAYEKLLTRDRAQFIVGEVNSHVALAALDVVAKYQTPTILAIPASDELGKKVAQEPDKFGCVFMTDPPVSRMYEGAFVWMDEILDTGRYRPEDNSLALIVEDTDWGRTVGDMWRGEMTARGWEIVVDEIVEFGGVDYYPVLTKVKRAAPALVKVELTSLPAGVSFTKQFQETGIEALVFGGYYMKSAEFPEMAAGTAEYACNIREPYPESWKEKVTGKYANADPIGSMYSYDSLYILKEAVERAGTVEAAAVVAELKDTDYDGVFMRTVYDEETHFARAGKEYKLYGVSQYRDGNLWLIWPDEYQEQEFELPPELK